MIGNRGAPPLAGNIDVAAGTASRAERSRDDPQLALTDAGLAEEHLDRFGVNGY
jgi:hypothetical protein